jgi:hypothetical protein
MLNMSWRTIQSCGTFIGFQTQEINDVFLELKPFSLDIFVEDESQQLSEVVVQVQKKKVFRQGEQVQKRL